MNDNNITYISLPSGETLPVSILNDNTYVNQDIDLEQLIYWISDNNIMAKYRIFVLYPDETINYELPQEDILADGSYSENYQNGQRRSLTFSLYNIDGKYNPNINQFWAGTRLKLDLGVQLPDNNVVWFQKGIFIISQIDQSLSAEKPIVKVTANDKFSLFEEKTGVLEASYEIDINAEIEQVIQTILLTDMGNSYPMDPQKFIYHASFKGKRTQVKISKSAGDTLGSILLDLGTQLSAEIFYNSLGMLTIVPLNEISQDVDKPTIFNYEFDKGDIGTIDFNYNLSNIINRIIVIGSNNNNFAKGVAVNNDPGSPLCVQRIGYRTGNVINDSNITSDLLAQERAQYELRSQLIIKSTINLQVLFNPILNVNNLVTISCDFFNLNHEKFLIQSISCNLDYNGSMSIGVTNIKNIKTLVSTN